MNANERAAELFKKNKTPSERDVAISIQDAEVDAANEVWFYILEEIGKSKKPELGGYIQKLHDRQYNDHDKSDHDQIETERIMDKHFRSSQSNHDT